MGASKEATSHAVAQAPEDQILVSPATIPQNAQPATVNTITKIHGAFITMALQVLFKDSTDIDNFFKAEHDHVGFIAWFNANASNRGPWSGKSIGAGMDVHAAFDSIWDRIPDMFDPPDDVPPTQINLLQFLCLVSIFINEVGAKMKPITESFGLPGHPGIAYLFDHIDEVINGNRVQKRTYNTSKTAKDCFNDADFLAAHGSLPFGTTLAHTTDAAWAGDTYPKDAQGSYRFPTDLTAAGIIGEADFCKFRGRGYIQSTFRVSYVQLIQLILAYTGTDPTILKYKTRWSGKTDDAVASISSNADWDDLFQNTNNVIPCAGVRFHNRTHSNYLSLSGSAPTLNGSGVGSVYFMGAAISGGQAYARLFKSRVIVLCNLLGNGTVWSDDPSP